MRLTDILKQDFPEPRWAVPSILPEGLTILAGKPKTGKSWLGLSLALDIGSGGKALGSKQVEQGRVLYLALEDPYRRIKERTETLLSGSDAVLDNIDVYNDWKPLNGEGLEELKTYLLVHTDTRLVIIDTLEKAMPRKSTRNSNSYGDDYAAISSLKKLADTHEVSFLVIHHLRKADATDPQDMISGTTGLTGAADGSLVLQRARGDHSATLTITGRDVEERVMVLTQNPDTCRWILEGDAIEHMTPERRQILALLRNGPMHYKKIAEALGKAEGTVKTLLHRMFGDGLVSQPERGQYAVAGYKAQATPAEADLSGQHGAHAASQPAEQAAARSDGDIVSNDVTTVTNETDVTGVTTVTFPSPIQPGPETKSYSGYSSCADAVKQSFGLSLEQAARWLDTTVEELVKDKHLPMNLRDRLKAELHRQAHAKGLGGEQDVAYRMGATRGIRDYPAAFAFVENYKSAA